MKKFLLPIIALVLIVGCSKKITISKLESESFELFYDKFHENLSFQLERVHFPLEGSYEGPDGSKTWEESEWQMHRQKVTEISNPDYETEFLRMENEVIDRVRQNDGGFEIERRFRLLNGKWYLTYYQTTNL